MEYYNFGNEHKIEDALIKNNNQFSSEHFKNNPELLVKLLHIQPHNLGIAVIKHPRLNYYESIINIIKIHKPKLELIYSNITTFSDETIKKLYPDLLTDQTMLNLLTSFYGNLESILIVYSGGDSNTQNDLNELKKINENGIEKPGVIRNEIESVKYSKKVFELWKQRFFQTNSAYLLARCYLLGRGIHMPDSNREAVNLLNEYIKPFN